jgi:hypothetical protein
MKNEKIVKAIIGSQNTAVTTFANSKADSAF